MKNIRSSNTKPELFISKALKKHNLYFSRNVKSIFGKPDIVFRSRKLIVFIDSDFWHGNPSRCRMPKSNKKYWINKIEGNIQRDKFVNKVLKKDGWRIIRIWEFDLLKNPNKYVQKILDALSEFRIK